MLQLEEMEFIMRNALILKMHLRELCTTLQGLYISFSFKARQSIERIKH